MRKASPKPVVFCHSIHAEWGRGVLVEENPSKLYVSFENVGMRVFLNAPKYRALLQLVELPPEEAKALVARIQKGGTAASKPAGGKPAASKSAGGKPAASKSAGGKPAVSKPAASKPAAAKAPSPAKPPAAKKRAARASRA